MTPALLWVAGKLGQALTLVDIATDLLKKSASGG